MTHTRDTSIATLQVCLGEFATDHDLPAIADELFWEVESWDVTKVDGATFWQTVEAHQIGRRSC